MNRQNKALTGSQSLDSWSGDVLSVIQYLFYLLYFSMCLEKAQLFKFRAVERGSNSTKYTEYAESLLIYIYDNQDFIKM